MADARFDIVCRTRRARATARKGTGAVNSELNSLATMYYRLLHRHKRQGGQHSATIPRKEAGKRSVSPAVPKGDTVDPPRLALLSLTPEPKRTSKLLCYTPKAAAKLKTPSFREVGCPIPELRPRKLVPFRENYYQQSVKLKANRSHELKVRRVRNVFSVRKHITKADDLPQLKPRQQTAKPWSVGSSSESSL